MTLNQTYRRPADRNAFEVAILCALPIESDAVEALFDQFYEEEDDEQYGKVGGDPNSYTLGRIGRHNVVLAYMPAMGKVNAAMVAAFFRLSFPNVRLGLVAGICGGVPVPTTQEGNIFLGDVIISTGIVQFDFGRQYPNKLVRKDTLQDALGRPNHEIRAFLTKLQGWRARSTFQRHITQYVAELKREQGFETLVYPGQENDRLYQPGYWHKHQNPTDCDICRKCAGSEDEICDAALEMSCAQLRCDDAQLLERKRPSESHPTVHFGVLASGDVVMRSAPHRDRLAAVEKVIGFEMEGAGVWENFPTIVIKSVCDYADSHKCKTWQRYSACVAGAAVKAFLRQWAAIETGETSLAISDTTESSPFSHTTNPEVESVISDAGSNSTNNQRLQETLSSRSSKILEKQSASREQPLQMDQLKLPDEYASSIRGTVRKRILQKLAFRGMHDRVANVQTNYPETFNWIFQQRAQDDDRWANFPKWLQNGSGCYWISGKAASGKSTLMKFLIKDPRTHGHLRLWAGGDKLICASFYFWYLGTSIQKSQTGLVRSLLFTVLKEMEMLTEDIFPDYFEEMVNYETIRVQNGGRYPEGCVMPKDLTHQEYWSSFLKIPTLVPGNYRMCFFIDGIDEYSGDHYEISELLRNYTSPRIKLVLSSRPIPACIHSFKGCASLRLEDLTRRDIDRYVNGEVRKHLTMQHLLEADRARANRLLDNIMHRADGVFLWVVLVVKSLMKGLNSLDTMDDLETRLDSFPIELHKLYGHIMEQIEPIYRSKAAEVILIVLHSLELDKVLTLLQLSFADEKNLRAVLNQGWSPNDLKQRMIVMEARLASRCRGLIEAPENSAQSYSTDARVRFLHKSVADFLKQPEVRTYVEEMVTNPRFNASEALLSSALCIGKCRVHRQNLGRVFSDIMCHAQNAELAGLEVAPYLEDPVILKAAASYTSWCAKFSPPLPPAVSRCGNKNERVLLLCVWYGLASSVARILEAGPHSLTNTSYGNLLWAAMTALDSQETETHKAVENCKARVKIVEILLARGSDPNVKIDQSSAWSILLVALVKWSYSVREDRTAASWLKIELYSRLVVTFLHSGANPHLVVIGYLFLAPQSNESDGMFYRSISALIEDVNASLLESVAMTHDTREILRKDSSEVFNRLTKAGIQSWRLSLDEEQFIGSDPSLWSPEGALGILTKSCVVVDGVNNTIKWLDYIYLPGNTTALRPL